MAARMDVRRRSIRHRGFATSVDRRRADNFRPMTERLTKRCTVCGRFARITPTTTLHRVRPRGVRVGVCVRTRLRLRARRSRGQSTALVAASRFMASRERSRRKSPPRAARRSRSKKSQERREARQEREEDRSSGRSPLRSAPRSDRHSIRRPTAPTTRVDPAGLGRRRAARRPCLDRRGHARSAAARARPSARRRCRSSRRWRTGGPSACARTTSARRFARRSPTRACARRSRTIVSDQPREP